MMSADNNKHTSKARGKVLLMTGWWLPEYAAAAALLLRCAFKFQAKVHGASARKLSEELMKEVGKYDEIFILGIDLTQHPETTCKAVADLRAKGTAVYLISGMHIPDSVIEAYRVRGGNLCFNQVWCSNDGELLNAVRVAFKNHFNSVISDEDNDFFNEYVEYVRKNPDFVRKPNKDLKDLDSREAYKRLFRATDWWHKCYRECQYYAAAIFDFAKMTQPKDFDASTKKQIDDYIRWGHRVLQGESAHMAEVCKLIIRAAEADDSNARVLITGPSGTGKETVAQQIHMKSPRSKNGTFLSFNCACTTKSLVESTLFGYAPQSFTGADKKGKDGLFARAEGGTLFLDEIGELDLAVQAQLLRVLQDGYYQRVGDPDERRIENVRIIAATNRNLVNMILEGTFREDLYYRLNVIQIRMQALTDRKADIKPIANDLWKAIHKTKIPLNAEQIKALEAYDYPGNVRELENILRRAHAMKISDFAQLINDWKLENVGLDLVSETDPVPTVDETLEAAKRRHVRQVAAAHKGESQEKIAKILGIAIGTLKSYMT